MIAVTFGGRTYEAAGEDLQHTNGVKKETIHYNRFLSLYNMRQIKCNGPVA